MASTVALRAFPVTMSREEAEMQARKKGGPLGRLMLRGRRVHEIRLHYVEYALMEFEAVHTPNIISRTFFRDRDIKGQLCRVIVNCSSGGAAWAEEIPGDEVELTVQAGQVQPGTFSHNELEGRGRKLVMRVLRRRIGGYPDINLANCRSIYRPFYVALYGEAVEGTKIRYLPFAADGWGTHRTF